MGRQRRGVAPVLSFGACTRVEVLVTVLLVSTALVGVMTGMRALGTTEVRARDADRLQHLAAQKMNELGVVGDLNAAEDNGDFTEQGYPEISWTMDVQPSGTENVDTVTVTVSQGDDEQSLTGLIYVRPVTGSTEQ